MVFNFREGERRSHISDILSQYDMTIMEYPRQYEGCPLLPLEMILHFLRSSESWLSVEGQQNVLLMYCEGGGWPILAFMLAGLLLYRRQYSGEQKTLEMIYKQAPKQLLHLLSPLNPHTSQLRYLQYISRINLGSNWPPPDTPLLLDCLILRVLPLFEDDKGCRPSIRVFGQDPSTQPNRESKLLFSTLKTRKLIRHYSQAECVLVKIDVHCRVQGDIVLECFHLDEDLIHEEMMFRVMFNTAFVRANILALNRDEIDIMWDAKDHFPKDFRAEVLFLDADAVVPILTTVGASEDGTETESASPDEFFEVEEIFSNVMDEQEGRGEYNTSIAHNNLTQDSDNKEVWKEDIDPHTFQDCASDDRNQKQYKKMDFNFDAVKDITVDDVRYKLDVKVESNPNLVKDIAVDHGNTKSNFMLAAADIMINAEAKEVIEDVLGKLESMEDKVDGEETASPEKTESTFSQQILIADISRQTPEKLQLATPRKQLITRTETTVDIVVGKQKTKQQEPNSVKLAKPNAVSKWVPPNKGSSTNSMQVTCLPNSVHTTHSTSRQNSMPSSPVSAKESSPNAKSKMISVAASVENIVPKDATKEIKNRKVDLVKASQSVLDMPVSSSTLPVQSIQEAEASSLFPAEANVSQPEIVSIDSSLPPSPPLPALLKFSAVTQMSSSFVIDMLPPRSSSPSSSNLHVGSAPPPPLLTFPSSGTTSVRPLSSSLPSSPLPPPPPLPPLLLFSRHNNETMLSSSPLSPSVGGNTSLLLTTITSSPSPPSTKSDLTFTKHIEYGGDDVYIPPPPPPPPRIHGAQSPIPHLPPTPPSPIVQKAPPWPQPHPSQKAQPPLFDVPSPPPIYETPTPPTTPIHGEPSSPPLPSSARRALSLQAPPLLPMCWAPLLPPSLPVCQVPSPPLPPPMCQAPSLPLPPPMCQAPSPSLPMCQEPPPPPPLPLMGGTPTPLRPTPMGGTPPSSSTICGAPPPPPLICWPLPPLISGEATPSPPSMYEALPLPSPSIHGALPSQPPLMHGSPPPPLMHESLPLPPPPPPVHVLPPAPPSLMHSAPPSPPPQPKPQSLPLMHGSLLPLSPSMHGPPPPPLMHGPPSTPPHLMLDLPPPPPPLPPPPPPPPLLPRPMLESSPLPPFLMLESPSLPSPSMLAPLPPLAPPMLKPPPPPPPPPANTALLLPPLPANGPPPPRGGIQGPPPPPPPGGFGPRPPAPPGPPVGAPHPPPLGAKGGAIDLRGLSMGRGRGLSRMGPSPTAPRRSSLKPLHWSKVTKALKGSLWEELQRHGELQIAPEFDLLEIERLFSAAVPKPSDSGGKCGGKRDSTASKSDKVHLIDLRRANNTEIMLTKVKMPLPDMMAAILAMDALVLDVDQVENLIKFCPTKEEMELLKGYTGDKDSLGKCEQYFMELMKVPRVESKLRIFSFKIQFCSQISEFKKSLTTVNSACEEVRNSAKLKEIMKRILFLGNTLNQGTARGSAVGFKLDSLLKLSDTRASTSKMTLMHYLCKGLASKSPGLLDLHLDLISLEPVSKVQLKALAEEMQAIIKGLEKVKQELTASENDGPISETFCKTLKEFIADSEAEVASVTNLYTVVGKNADTLALYFGEDPARYPFEQVTSTLLNFIRLFRKAHEENLKNEEMERKKAEKEAEMANTKDTNLTKKQQSR